MKLKVFYKEYFLGDLQIKKNGFVYNSSEEECVAKKQYLLEISEYSQLLGSKNKKSESLFEFFADIAENIKKRQDLVENAGILEHDSNFDALAKFSKLKQTKHHFYFATEN